MPKISAATVAEHRAAQRRALLDAAAAIVAEHGVAGLLPRAVSERAGLARSSFYEYFSSKDDLVAALAVEPFGAWAAELEAALAVAPAGRPRLHAYVEATLGMVADGRHALAAELQQADLSRASLDAIMAMHDGLVAPLRRTLDEVGLPDPDGAAALVQGVLDAGVRRVAHGASAEEVGASIIALLDRGLRP